MKKLAHALLLSLLVLTGCSGAWAVVTEVIAAVADAIPIVEEIAQWVDRHFAAQPDPQAQALVDAKLDGYRSCLVKVNRVAQDYGKGAELDQSKADCAKAWTDLSSTLAGLKGTKRLARAGGEPGLSLADEKTGAVLAVPVPLAGDWR